jgi:hypothetical protein
MPVHGRRASKPIDTVAAYKPLYLCGMEELAARQHTLEPSGGVLFARNRERENKDTAREAIIDLFAPKRWPDRLHLLTMPGLEWKFERLLLAAREQGWMQARNPRRTLITGVESDRAIYFASVTQMPGIETPDRVIKPVERRNGEQAFFEMGVKTRYAAFFFADVDDLMKQSNWTGWDAAWIDYTGPLTVQRLKLIKRFFHIFVRDTLIVTAMKARWNEATSAAIARAGSHSSWLRQNLFGEILHDIEYIDTVPMAQFAVRHPIENLGHSVIESHRFNAEIAAAGRAALDAQQTDAGGGTYPEHLGRAASDTPENCAEIAAVGQRSSDARLHGADGGTKHLGQPICEAHAQPAEIAAAGRSDLDARRAPADGGTNQANLGRKIIDTRKVYAGIAAAGHVLDGARIALADGGTSSKHLGLVEHDARRASAETAAAGHLADDAQQALAGGGTYSRNLGHVGVDARISTAEIAAAGHVGIDVHGASAGGGTNPQNLGQRACDAQALLAEITATGRRRNDARSITAGGGPIPKRRKRKCRKSKSAIRKPPHKKRGKRSASASRPKSGKRPRPAKPRRRPQPRKRPQRSASAKPRAKASAKRAKQ